MKRPLKPEEQKIWSMVAATVHPLTGRGAPRKPMPQTLDAAARIEPKRVEEAKKRLREALEGIEPNRHHRIVRRREEIGARIDLHGMTQDRARAALDAFVARAFDDGWRAVLVVTGKGVQGDGVLRKRVPDWLGAPHLVHMVAGISEAARHHGGAGALYVALKKKR